VARCPLIRSFSQKEREIMFDPFGPPDHSWIFKYFNERPEEERLQFIRDVFENMLDVHSPAEMAQKFLVRDCSPLMVQKVLGVNSPEEVAQILLDADYPALMAQKALGVNSPEEVAVQLLQADSPIETVFKALGVNSRVEAALKFVKTEEQRRKFLVRLQQMGI
jgi:hypothetical protein